MIVMHRNVNTAICVQYLSMRLKNCCYVVFIITIDESDAVEEYL